MKSILIQNLLNCHFWQSLWMLIFCKYFSKLAKVLKLDNCYIWFHEKYVWHTLFHEFCQHHDVFPFWISCLLDHWAILSFVYKARSTHKLYFISKASFYTFFEKCDFDIQAQIAGINFEFQIGVFIDVLHNPQWEKTKHFLYL